VAKYINERNDPFEIPKEKSTKTTLGALKGLLAGENSKPAAKRGLFGMKPTAE
jgi:hypothetical protein